MKKTLTHKISITKLPVCMRTLGGKKNNFPKQPFEVVKRTIQIFKLWF